MTEYPRTHTDSLADSDVFSRDSESRLGRLGVRKSVMLEAIGRDRAPLPEGYQYAGKIKAKELASLMQEVGWPATTPSLRRDRRVWGSKGISTFEVGVRDKSGKLVGYGALFHKGKDGELGNFVVSPDHQGQGIGKVIIDERLEMAEQTGLTSLYMPFLDQTNTLRSYYEEKGFREGTSGEVVRGPHAVSITGTQPIPVQPTLH
jgi:ribosomal protein S18 acetylase RimI-like enzyme